MVALSGGRCALSLLLCTAGRRRLPKVVILGPDPRISLQPRKSEVAFSGPVARPSPSPSPPRGEGMVARSGGRCARSLVLCAAGRCRLRRVVILEPDPKISTWSRKPYAALAGPIACPLTLTLSSKPVSGQGTAGAAPGPSHFPKYSRRRHPHHPHRTALGGRRARLPKPSVPPTAPGLTPAPARGSSPCRHRSCVPAGRTLPAGAGGRVPPRRRARRARSSPVRGRR